MQSTSVCVEFGARIRRLPFAVCVSHCFSGTADTTAILHFTCSHLVFFVFLSLSRFVLPFAALGRDANDKNKSSWKTTHWPIPKQRQQQQQQQYQTDKWKSNNKNVRKSVGVSALSLSISSCMFVFAVCVASASFLFRCHQDRHETWDRTKKYIYYFWWRWSEINEMKN